ncbi:MAG: thioredoxin family protein [Bacteroidetes bacterium]|nr:thioredoxin family protein [Bacteroidota bacterium]
MKKLIFFCLIISFSFSSTNNVGVVFNSAGWSDVSKKAKDNDKPIFVFIRTYTCVTSARMDGVFKQPNVAAFFNENFISTQLNPDKPLDNVRVAQWGATGVPTFVFLSSDKKLIHKFYGYKDEKGVIKEAEKALKLMGIKNYKMGDASKYKAPDEDEEDSEDDEKKE